MRSQIPNAAPSFFCVLLTKATDLDGLSDDWRQSRKPLLSSRRRLPSAAAQAKQGPNRESNKQSRRFLQLRNVQKVASQERRQNQSRKRGLQSRSRRHVSIQKIPGNLRTPGRRRTRPKTGPLEVLNRRANRTCACRDEAACCPRQAGGRRWCRTTRVCSRQIDESADAVAPSHRTYPL